ncbi:MAG: hypothetical protein ACTSXX_07510 [Candidatus Baldrarchaeia archaeon]
MHGGPLKKLLLILTIMALLILLALPTHIAYGLAEKSATHTKGTSEIVLGTTYKDTFDYLHKEKFYILKVTEPGIYLISANVTIYGVASGELELKTWGETYLPWIDENVTVKSTIASYDFYNNGTREDKIVFVGTGEVYIVWDWSIDEISERAETTLTVKKLATLAEATAFTNEVSYNFTEGDTIRLYKFVVADAGFYNITISSVCTVNTSVYIDYLELNIYVGTLYADENLTIYLNGHKIAVLTNRSYGSWFTRIPLEYANLTGENNLTLVYKGPSFAYVGDAYLTLHYWRFTGEYWESEEEDICYWGIYDYIYDTWSGTDYAYLVYTTIPNPIKRVQIFDDVHGTKMANRTFHGGLLSIRLAGNAEKITTTIGMAYSYLDSGTYYLWVDVGSFTFMDEKPIGYAYLKTSVKKLDVVTIDTEGTLKLTFNFTNYQKYVALHLPPDNYYNISLAIVSGGNWSISAYTLTGAVALEHGIWGTKESIRKQHQMLQNVVVIPFYGYYYAYPYYFFMPTYKERDITGVFCLTQMYYIMGENVTYVDGKLSGLEEFTTYPDVVPEMLLYVVASPVTDYTPSTSVSVELSVKVTGTVETLSPGEKKTVDFNSTTGPTYRVYKTTLAIGSLYNINGTPLKYTKNGNVTIMVIPTSIEDWTMFLGTNVITPFLQKSATNRSVYFVIFPAAPNATYYVTLSVKNGDTSRASIEIVKYEAKDYKFGEELALSLVSPDINPSVLEKCIYRFEVKENYTYVITIETGANFTEYAAVYLIDAYGNAPFKYKESYIFVLVPMYAFPMYMVSEQCKEVSWEFIAKENATVIMVITSSSGTLNITITEIKSYEAGYSEGYNAGYSEGNETGYQTGYESGYKSGYEGGSSTGQIMGVAIGAPVGLVIGVAVVYLIMRRRIAA